MPITHHQERRQALYKLSRRTTVVMSGVVGALAGFMAVLFRVLLEQLDLWRTLGFPLLWADYGFVGLAILVGIGALLGGLSAWLTQRYCPEAGGSGIPHVKAVLGYARPLRAARVMVTKIGAGLLALGAGMSLGREGPTVHIGGACAELFGRRFNFPVRTRRSLIAAGAGAGLAAAFNAPLAGFLFIMEELRKDMSRATYANALVTSVSAVGVTQLLLGYNAVFTLPAPQPLYLNAIPALVLLGILGSLVGVAFNKLLLAASASSGFKVHKGVLAGAIAALLTLTFPEVTGGGNELTLSLLEGEGSSRVWSGLALLLFVKLMFTVFCYSSGVPGGFFAPLLTMGAILGSLVSVLMTKFVPAWTPESGQLAIVGMAVVLTASVRAPLTGVVLIVEMTGWYHLLYSLLFASMVSYAISELTSSEPIYEALFKRDLQLGKRSLDADAFEVTIEPGSALDGAQLRRLKLPEDLLIAVIERDGNASVPHGSHRILAGDILTVVAGPHCAETELAGFLESAKI